MFRKTYLIPNFEDPSSPVILKRQSMFAHFSRSMLILSVCCVTNWSNHTTLNPVNHQFKINQSHYIGKITRLSPTQPSDHYQVLSLLQTQWQDWQGVTYKWGGVSRDGIDCSAFVMLTFKQLFGMNLPRTTWHQKDWGIHIDKAALAYGDLVFFRTGHARRHVGIYMGNHTFMHVSESRGVMISKLTSPYWRKHYWQSRRVLHSRNIKLKHGLKNIT